MILVKLLIIFFIYLILAHIFSLHTIIEGAANAGDDSDESSKPDLSTNYQENSSVSNTEQATTAKQAGEISALQKTAKQLKQDIDDMKNTLTKVNDASAKNTSNLNSLKSDKCSTPAKVVSNSKTT